MSHKVYVGKQGSILKAEFSPQGLENPVTYVPEVPEWDGKTLVRDIKSECEAWVWWDGTWNRECFCMTKGELKVFLPYPEEEWVNPGEIVELFFNNNGPEPYSSMDAPAIPIVEPKPLEGEEWDSSLCEKLDRIAEDALKAARAGELKDFPGDEAEEGVTEC